MRLGGALAAAMMGPNFFGVVEVFDGKLRPVVKMSVPAETATVAPSPACKIAG
ncbi:hypothetical protein [Xanthobacter sp.]|uniref:hypothetical protein n=1 Tax=Xanthobacter sp. TaxID=35809 RepID=UPI0025DB4A68|nr:hypothetical protein [Xanthobacter sp.]